MKLNRNRLRKILIIVSSVIAASYMLAAFAVGRYVRANDRCNGLRIEVMEDTRRNFVTAREIARELGDLPQRASGMMLSDINTQNIASRLRRIDKIEDVAVVKTTDNRILITVTPLIPVARVFDGKESYYINKDNKHISANARYFMDVPVISGHFSAADTAFTPAKLLPLLRWLADHDKWGRLVTMIKADSPHDIIVVPAINGHVINLGEPCDFDSKFERIGRFYTTVMPVKGWNHYDTLSVKFGGQIVATRRVKPLAAPVTAVDDEDDTADIQTMLAAEGVEPGQSLPGRKARVEKPIPGARESNHADTTTRKKQ